METTPQTDSRITILQKIWREIKRPFAKKQWRQWLEKFDPSPEWLLAQERIRKSKIMVDLGCGTSPHPLAKVAVDWFIDPEHRLLGTGKQIDLVKMAECGKKFVHANLEKLPFMDKEFDFSYSHHVIEHVENPHLACEEIMRCSHEGVIICPSAFAETAFGRPYHLWQVSARGNRVDRNVFQRTNTTEHTGKT